METFEVPETLNDVVSPALQVNLETSIVIDVLTSCALTVTIAVAL